jgi:hypothetical protein
MKPAVPAEMPAAVCFRVPPARRRPIKAAAAPVPAMKAAVRPGMPGAARPPAVLLPGSSVPKLLPQQVAVVAEVPVLHAAAAAAQTPLLLSRAASQL